MIAGWQCSILNMDVGRLVGFDVNHCYGLPNRIMKESASLTYIIPFLVSEAWYYSFWLGHRECMLILQSRALFRFFDSIDFKIFQEELNFTKRPGLEESENMSEDEMCSLTGQQEHVE